LRPLITPIAALVGHTTSVRLAPTGLAAWSEQQQVLQGRKAWETVREWIELVNPRFSFEVAERYLMARASSNADMEAAQTLREAIRQRMAAVLADGAVVCLPTTPTLAPRRGERPLARRELRGRISMLTCIAGTTGTPQISLPLAEVDGLPVGLSLLGSRGADEVLLAFAREVAGALGG
jgi:amidase